MVSSSIEFSPLESDRFGLRVGRLTLALDTRLPDVSSFDVVIVRQPSGATGAALRLAMVDGYVAIHADTLSIWHWIDDEQRIPVSDSSWVSREIETAEIADWMRASFVGYNNHYAANPLFSSQKSLDGYVEWAQALFDKDPDGLVVVGESEEMMGFALVDWSTSPPDVRLNAVNPTARNQGWFRRLIAEVMQEARGRGHEGLVSSTQAHNVAVQRAWASLGWKPSSPLDTTHLVRRSLLS